MSSPVTVRQARVEDAEGFRRLLVGFTGYADKVPWDDYLARYSARVDDPTWCLIVAEDQSGELIGYAVAQDFTPNLRATFTVGRVDDLWVDPERRRGGTGRALMEAVFDWARSRPQPMVLDWQSTPEAVAFYEAMGFEADRVGDQAEYPAFCLDLRTR
ncbi:GNAT family N-acetyltransferase [Aestuariimicrobium ganziense]|uniref:GNAT family N-acetyltransferase n=1 Tax=Aestuariimicrobium ganziense TaxID=2773677 RepID=UPI0019445C6B|nr:GNAT family N-acetyltransferase [Aestuariimicrobium ganziense]